MRQFFLDGGHGLSITVPHKWSAFQIANELSDEALLAGTCNTLMASDEGLYGHNTDGLGLIDDLDRLGWSPAGKRILLLEQVVLWRVVWVRWLRENLKKW